MLVQHLVPQNHRDYYGRACDVDCEGDCEGDCGGDFKCDLVLIFCKWQVFSVQCGDDIGIYF